jgi:glutamine amidotransferase
MGRMAAYLGPRTKIADVLEGGSYALLQQSTECPDGFGVTWYPDDGDPTPVGLTSELPGARAESALGVPRRFESECVVASLRRAARLPAALAGHQPLSHGRYVFSYDGELERFEEVFMRPLRDRLSDERYQALRTTAVAELLFATWLDALEDAEGPDAMASALEKMVGTVGDIAAAAGVGASFAVVVTDGQCLITLRAATQGPPPALYTIVAGPDAPVPATARVVASEPLFPGAWSSLDPHSLVIFTVEPEPEDHPTETSA